MTEIARDFRKEPTKSESILWRALRGKKLDGIKFRRRQPVSPFIIDFYNSLYRLVIELMTRSMIPVSKPIKTDKVFWKM